MQLARLREGTFAVPVDLANVFAHRKSALMWRVRI